jgi:Bifunctional DNA primase/polymerase, N-terminal
MSVDFATILLFADRGFPVLPLCRPTPQGCSYPRRTHAPICPDPGKKPIPYAGVRGARRDPDKIRQFWQWFPDANLGVAMGAVSGHFVMEADGPKGAALLRRFRLPPTPTVLSRRGHHVYLRIPPGYTMRTEHFEELDVIGDRGYVVGPGSRHPSGHLYRWQDYLSLNDLDPAYPPEPLLSWLADHHVLLRDTTPTRTLRTREKAKIAPTSARPAGETSTTRKTSPQGGGVLRLSLLLYLRLVAPPSKNCSRNWRRNPMFAPPVWPFSGSMMFAWASSFCVDCLGIVSGIPRPCLRWARRTTWSIGICMRRPMMNSRYTRCQAFIGPLSEGVCSGHMRH